MGDRFEGITRTIKLSLRIQNHRENLSLSVRSYIRILYIEFTRYNCFPLNSRPSSPSKKHPKIPFPSSIHPHTHTYTPSSPFLKILGCRRSITLVEKRGKGRRGGGKTIIWSDGESVTKIRAAKASRNGWVARARN